MSESGTSRLKRRNFIELAGVGGASVFLAGCLGGEDDDDDDVDDDDNGEADEAPSPGDGTGTVTYATTITPSTIDPHRVSDNLETLYAGNVYDGILSYTYETPPEIVEGIAEDWEVDEDGTTFRFTIRDDAEFHNGDPVTAEDVAYSIERVMDLGDGFSWMWAGFIDPDQIEVENDNVVKVELLEPFAPLLATLPYLFVVNEDQVADEADDWLEDNDAGSGAYQLVSHDLSEEIVLERNEDSWREFADEDRAFDEVVINMVPEPASVVGMMRDESADMTDEWLAFESYFDLQEEDHIWLSDEITLSPLYVFMHNQREPLDDPDFRRAISYAVDYDQIVEDIMDGLSEPMIGPMPQEARWHNPDVTQYEFDLEQAQQYLDQSEYDPEEYDLTYTYVTGLAISENIGLLMQTTLGEIGINLELEAAPWSRIVEDTTSMESTSDMHSIYIGFSYADPDNWLYPVWHTDSHGSWQSPAWYDNEQVDQLLDDGRRTVDDDQREAIYREAQEIIADEAGGLFIHNEAQLFAINNRVGGFQDTGMMGLSHMFWHMYEDI